MAIAAFVVALLAIVASVEAVWPPPQRIALGSGNTPMALTHDFAIKWADETFTTSRSSSRLDRAMLRYNRLVVPPRTASSRAAIGAAGSHIMIQSLFVQVGNLSEASLSMDTSYNYTLTITGVSQQNNLIHADTIYGAMYAMETFAQLIDIETGTFPTSSVSVTDAPDYPWRGLMVDTGRRFAPLKLLFNIIDTMAAVKLNVLHLHASDFCRFSVESKLYPNLTASLTGINEGFYTQEDVKTLIAYAGDRGVRVVPEFEMPAHARCFLPIQSAGGLEFCNTSAYPGGHGVSQLRGSDGTFKVLHDVLGEMAGLFTDDVFHIGADEAFVKTGNCDVNTTATLEQRVVAAVQHDFLKTPAGWEQVFFDTHAATNETIVYAYMADGSAPQITSSGRRVVQANSTAFYFTVASPGGPKGWDMCWSDIASNIPVEQKQLMLGGEMSMWTDTYCHVRECGAMPQYKLEVGAALYNRSFDVEYGKSLGGMIWPRGFVGAASFWNYNSSITADSPEFVAAVWSTNTALSTRGSLVCPTNCSCNQMSACGVPYLPPLSSPPSPLPQLPLSPFSTTVHDLK
eukprot:m.120539 g.120539  ORF g.120539 m.120539 type:complete len:571 (-) comp28809_c0_seq2:2399-4111(-)